MPSTWKKYKISEVAEVKYGKDHKHLAIGKIPVYGSGGIMRYADRALYEKESVLIPRKGTLSNLFYLDKPFWSVDTMFYTKLSKQINGKYFYYNLKTLDLAGMDVGSAVPSLTTELLNRIEITLPPLEEQTAIAEILSALDDKIELNLQTNKTLEDMANALYKHWFVDFGPFKNGKFIESELGLIPDGWEVKSIGDSIETIGGGTPSTSIKEYWENGEINWYSPTDLSKQNSLFSNYSEKKISSLGLLKSSARLLPAYSILMSSRATIGLITINTVASCTNQGFISLVPTKEISLYQIIGWLKANMDLINSKANGSTFKEISKSSFRDLNILKAKNIEEFINSSKQIFSLIENNIYETQSLKQTRDYLLPKLISGEIRVKEISKKVKVVA